MLSQLSIKEKLTMNVLGKTQIEIVTMEGSHKYKIKNTQGEFIYLEGTTLLGEVLRFDSKNYCLETFNDATMKWDIYIGDYQIIQVNLY